MPKNLKHYALEQDGVQFSFHRSLGAARLKKKKLAERNQVGARADIVRLADGRRWSE